MKKIYHFLMLLMLSILLVACGSSESTSKKEDKKTEESTKKSKKKKKSKDSQKSGKRQSDKAATSASETLIEAETSEALTSTAAEETRAAKKRTTATRASERGTEAGAGIREDGSYTSRDEVALYLHTYGKLPKNFISKKEAEEQGFRFGEGNFGEAFPGMSVGGSRFGNYEGQLPEKSGRRYYECDIDYQGGRRNAKRLVYSNDGLIFYTDDHYKSFTQLY